MKTPTIILAATVAITTFFAAPILRAHEGHKHPEKETASKTTKAAKPGKPAVKPYKPDTCIVSDDKLGEMGKPVVFEDKGQEIKLCCKACRKDFDKDPAKYLKKLGSKK